ncbi:MAG: COG1470 family protein [Gammaproteobacteria bacterium]
MSRVTVSSLAGNAVQRNMVEWLDVMPSLLTRSIDQYAALLKKSAEVVSGLVPNDLSQSDCCAVPETPCPPRCSYQIHWEAGRGETVQAHVKVTNSGSAAREFTFKAEPLQTGGQGDVPLPVVVEPAQATLQPGQAVTLNLRVAVDQKSSLAACYTGELVIHGGWEQCLKLLLDVSAGCDCVVEIQHGDPGVKVRAHQWYEHYQCTEPCKQQRTDVARGTVDIADR